MHPYLILVYKRATQLGATSQKYLALNRIKLSNAFEFKLRGKSMVHLLEQAPTTTQAAFATNVQWSAVARLPSFQVSSILSIRRKQRHFLCQTFMPTTFR